MGLEVRQARDPGQKFKEAPTTPSLILGVDSEKSRVL